MRWCKKAMSYFLHFLKSEVFHLREFTVQEKKNKTKPETLRLPDNVYECICKINTVWIRVRNKAEEKKKENKILPCEECALHISTFNKKPSNWKNSYQSVHGGKTGRGQTQWYFKLHPKIREKDEYIIFHWVQRKEEVQCRNLWHFLPSLFLVPTALISLSTDELFPWQTETGTPTEHNLDIICWSHSSCCLQEWEFLPEEF